MAKKKGQRVTTKAVQEMEGTPPPLSHKPEGEGDAPWGDDGLTFRQREFVKAYIGPAGGNATRAAEMAGYNANNRVTLACTASENLRKPQIQRALARALAEREGSPEWTLKGIVELARVSLADFITFDANGKATPDLKAAAAAGALGGIKRIRFHPETGDIVSIEPHDRLGALALLAKVHGQIVDKVEHSGTVNTTSDLSALTEDELRVARELRMKIAGAQRPASDN